MTGLFHSHVSTILVTCPRGMASCLKDEMVRLGFPVKSEHATGVETEGTLIDTMRVNLMVRTGHRVLFLLNDFSALTPDDLYRGVTALPWEDYLMRDGFFSVVSSVQNQYIRDTRFATLRCKDAIVDRFMKKYGSRPDTGSSKQGAVVFLYWHDNRCSLYLDTSGEPLSRRGYRTVPLAAPLQETLAAAVIMTTRWNGSDVFINPMCGSGTLAIEAASMAGGIAPGLTRKHFGFMHLKGFDASAWRDLTTRAKKSVTVPVRGTVIASDISRDAIEASRNNAARAGVDRFIEFHRCDFRETPVPGGPGVVVLNPEYGERMGHEDSLKTLYGEIGDFFKHRCRGMWGYVFTGNRDLAKKIGLRTARKILFMNGPIECRLLEYDLYQGSRKQLKSTGGYDK